MKETTGELSMTVIVLLGVAILAAAIAWLGPMAKEYIQDKWGDIADSDAGGATDPWS